MSAERLPYTTGVIGGAEVLAGGEITLHDSADSYTTPWLYGSHGEGLNEVAARFHADLRATHARWRAEHGIAGKPRPVILNLGGRVFRP